MSLKWFCKPGLSRCNKFKVFFTEFEWSITTFVPEEIIDVNPKKTNNILFCGPCQINCIFYTNKHFTPSVRNKNETITKEMSMLGLILNNP
jgi:hypothetical protein